MLRIGATHFCKTMESPVGTLRLVSTPDRLVAILWENGSPQTAPFGPLADGSSHPVLLEAEKQLTEYFAGRRKTFSLKLDGPGTGFQKEVWQALATIPFGETRSYAEIAAQIGRPKAVRAVGAANGKNPLAIVVPCHRVIGSNGKLTGFAGGLESKAWLLRFETPS